MISCMCANANMWMCVFLREIEGEKEKGRDLVVSVTTDGNLLVYLIGLSFYDFPEVFCHCASVVKKGWRDSFRFGLRISDQQNWIL